MSDQEQQSDGDENLDVESELPKIGSDLCENIELTGEARVQAVALNSDVNKALSWFKVGTGVVLAATIGLIIETIVLKGRTHKLQQDTRAKLQDINESKDIDRTVRRATQKVEGATQTVDRASGKTEIQNANLKTTQKNVEAATENVEAVTQVAEATTKKLEKVEKELVNSADELKDTAKLAKEVIAELKAFVREKPAVAQKPK